MAKPRSSLALAVKRALDIGVSLLVLALGSPIFLACAVLVRIGSRGPALYQGIRAGLHGKPFRILKFRTMVVDAERLAGPTTGTNDPRVTRVGWFLRRTKLDELPQFLNVLWGDMSLVGPRPEVLTYTDTYQGVEKKILSMRPGITDFSSLEFIDLDNLVGSSDPDRYFREIIMPRKTALRLRYVEEWSLGTDLTILRDTVRLLFRRARGC